MKNNKLKIIVSLSINIISTNLMFSQCPISFPKSLDVCLEGVQPNNNVCFKNSDGNLDLLFNGKTLFSFGKSKINGQTEGDTNKLVILGAFKTNPTSNFPNNLSPTSYRDISYEFKDAGSAKIRSYRGESWDTYLQFLTNLKSEGNDNPKVRMHINENGSVGIGTINPQALLDVNGGARVGNDNSDDSKLVIVGAVNLNNPDGQAAFVPSFKRDISYEFKDAGSAKIRSYRGGNWDTYLQFLTNLKNEGNDNPKVRMQINENGNIGIGTTNPQALLDVNGNVNISGRFFKMTTPSEVGDAVIQRSTVGNLIINSGLTASNGQESSLYLNYGQDYGGGTGGIKSMTEGHKIMSI